MHAQLVWQSCHVSTKTCCLTSANTIACIASIFQSMLSLLCQSSLTMVACFNISRAPEQPCKHNHSL
jgi:hypothetical protein